MNGRSLKLPLGDPKQAAVRSWVQSGLHPLCLQSYAQQSLTAPPAGVALLRTQKALLCQAREVDTSLSTELQCLNLEQAMLWESQLLVGNHGPLVTMPPTFAAAVAHYLVEAQNCLSLLAYQQTVCMRQAEVLQQLQLQLVELEQPYGLDILYDAGTTYDGLSPPSLWASDLGMPSSMHSQDYNHHEAVRSLASVDGSISDLINNWDHLGFNCRLCWERCGKAVQSLTETNAMLSGNTQFVGIRGLHSAVSHLYKAQSWMCKLPGQMSSVAAAVALAEAEMPRIVELVNDVCDSLPKMPKEAALSATGNRKQHLENMDALRKELQKQTLICIDALMSATSLSQQLSKTVWKLFCTVDSSQVVLYRFLPLGHPLACATVEEEDAEDTGTKAVKRC